MLKLKHKQLCELHLPLIVYLEWSDMSERD